MAKIKIKRLKLRKQGILTLALEWLAGLMKKFGVILLIGFLLWLGFKKIYFWLIMPILFLMLLKTCNLSIAETIDVRYLIGSWIFVFSMLSSFFSLVFVKK